MTNITFKTAETSEQAKDVYAEPQKEAEKTMPVNTESEVEPPFTEYKTFKKIPYVAEYLGLNLTWEEADMVEDVDAIEGYLKSLINDGDMENSIQAAKKKLKSMEKMANIDSIVGNARRVIELGEFARYMMKLEERKQKNDTD